MNNNIQTVINNPYLLGIDIGSTTVKFYLQKDGECVFSCYERHMSKVREKTFEILKRLSSVLKEDNIIKVVISGSAGLGIANATGLTFVQEVFATGEAIKTLEPDTDVVIELGGEDAKIIFFDEGGMDEKMNGSCAGGTGAFIDQMSTLLNITPNELDRLSLKHSQIYPIASRCGVFAKTDIQPLINQGAKKEDISASIYQAVVNQTIAGLAGGRKIKGKIVFLGGPLYYSRGLRQRFTETLELDSKNAVTPYYANISVALGAALYAKENGTEITYSELKNGIEKSLNTVSQLNSTDPLFKDEKEYNEFLAQHAKSNVQAVSVSDYSGNAYLGIDCGSTTTKLTLLDENDNILYSYYASNKGNPVTVVRDELKNIYKLCGDKIKIKSSCVTGYGEELIKSAFHIDFGLVETLAHFTAAQHFNPNVEFILDIGGQDIKCFKIRNNSIDSIMLNEACSSGCGSFIETFANAMGYNIEDFSKLALFAENPVDLGSRCTVFMNSSVKQAQRDGATVGDISAGLCMSVVKNALYKVIRATSAEELGSELVVQGGTFLNDAILRAFENEIGASVIRPNIAGLMGAYGAALYSKKNAGESSSIISNDELSVFKHTATPVTCKGCTNNCKLTVNNFSNGERFVSGNKCEKGAGKKKNSEDLPDLYNFKYNYHRSLKSNESGIKIGLPLALGMYDLLPFWHTVFTSLGYQVVMSDQSNKDLYLSGQYTIPSDTACYPAKLMHGHIENLISKGVDYIFYPSLTYNVKEKDTDNCFNCPVVAYYGELIDKNIENIKNTKFLYPYLNINNKRVLTNQIYKLSSEIKQTNKSDAASAIKKAYEALALYRKAVLAEGKKAITVARENNKKILVFAGRPYHIDPEINHGINKLATSLGLVIVSEDSVCDIESFKKVNVLNQWTFHSRMYKAAQFATQNDDVNLVQLVSFGCGLDAVTTDEIKSILEDNGKLYTQIKIDEIANLGTVKIRLRSLLGSLDAKEKANGK